MRAPRLSIETLRPCVSMCRDMDQRFAEVIFTALHETTMALQAFPDMEKAYGHILQIVFKAVPTARAAILVNDRHSKPAPTCFVSEVYRQRDVSSPVSFTPDCKALDAIYGGEEVYISPDRSHIIAAPMTVSGALRGVLYVEGT